MAWRGGRGGPPPQQNASDPRLDMASRFIDELYYAQKPVVKHQVIQLLQSQKHLQVAKESYVTNRGREDQLLKLHGTVPTVHQGSTYHTPLSIIVPLNFPVEPPIVAVPPAPGMHVSREQDTVSNSGRVRLYWVPSLQLAAAIQDLCVRFGVSPPLRSGPEPPPALSEQVADEMRTLARAVYQEMHGLLMVELERGLRINDRSDRLIQDIDKLKEAKEALTQHLQQLDKISPADGGKAEEDAVSLEADTAVERQMFDLVGRVLAAEDTIFMLDKAVENETINLKEFVKAVRRLARDKFEARALLQKIFGLQQQAVASGAWARRSRAFT